ncbi:MAG: UDP-N-acetylmuramoyl-L-alanyl-D-glutamate--2,6-diaminopimelate ligase [Gemmatimonadota bacterium]|nr:MAG: UDP-N-acetylmuramoyl-L-alanyl-D-glutamate--2,6-diaminopimelate ligase [Gemmatimonadota bacterium]
MVSNLKQILSVLPDADVIGESDIGFRKIAYDSRAVEPGDLFVALKGIGQDGHAFIPQAVQQGAVAVVVEEAYRAHGVVQVKVPNTRRALALLAAEYYGAPAQELSLIGITGTNGKTTISRLVKSILEAAGHKVGLIGTIEYWMGDERLPAGLTTPESLDLHGLFKKMIANGIGSVVLEVSSHSLSLDRVFGLNFDVGVFSNLSRDHLDFHKTLDEYERAKSMLFQSLDWARAKAVINRDDPSGRHMMEVSKAPVLSYGFDRESSVWANGFSLTAQASHFTVHAPDCEFAVDFRLLGRFNVYNALASVGVGYALDIEPSVIKEGLERIGTVEGRFERIDRGQPFTVIIDYSHTPDALEHCLTAARELSRGEVIVVFGCGGDRDSGKRSLMGEVASRLADRIIITSDNPRSEDPELILRDIEEGFPPHSAYEKIADRRQAIEKALGLARQGDCVVIAGKGHEAYQIIGRDRIPFSDRAEVERILRTYRETVS